MCCAMYLGRSGLDTICRLDSRASKRTSKFECHGRSMWRRAIAMAAIRKIAWIKLDAIFNFAVAIYNVTKLTGVMLRNCLNCLSR